MQEQEGRSRVGQHSMGTVVQIDRHTLFPKICAFFTLLKKINVLQLATGNCACSTNSNKPAQVCARSALCCNVLLLDIKPQTQKSALSCGTMPLLPASQCAPSLRETPTHLNLIGKVGVPLTSVPKDGNKSFPQNAVF